MITKTRFDNIVHYKMRFLLSEIQSVERVYPKFKHLRKDIRKLFPLLKGTFDFCNYKCIIVPSKSLKTFKTSLNSFEEYSTSLHNVLYEPLSNEEYIHAYITELKKYQDITPYLNVISNLEYNKQIKFTNTEIMFIIKYIKALFDNNSLHKKYTKLLKCSCYTCSINNIKIICDFTSTKGYVTKEDQEYKKLFGVYQNTSG